MTEIIILSLVCYRLSLLITHDEGPLSIFERLRQFAGGYDLAINGQPATNLGRGIICPLCAGLWIAIPLAIILSGFTSEAILHWLAIAGLQTILIKVTE